MVASDEVHDARIALKLYSWTWLDSIAEQLSLDLGPGLLERAQVEIDKASAGDVRQAAARYLADAARRLARERAATAEREATLSKCHAERETREAALKAEHEARWAEQRARNEARIAGHVGTKNPGSASKYNTCDRCQACREAWEREAEITREHTDRVRKIFERYEAEVRAEMLVEWTETLLGTEIAMPDGERVTWGAATVEQHRKRREMLMRNVTANAENAARHALAIEFLERTGADNLASAVIREVA